MSGKHEVSAPDAAAIKAVFSDLNTYLDGGHVLAATEILSDEAEVLLRDPLSALEAIELVGSYAHRDLESTGDEALAAEVLDALLAFACRAHPGIAAISKSRLLSYRRALILSRSRIIPIERVLRHVNLLAQFHSTSKLEGWVAEVGVFRGLSLLHMGCTEAERSPHWQGEGFVGLDSFSGLSEPGDEDKDFSGLGDFDQSRIGNMTQAGAFAADFATVSANVHKAFPKIELRRGWVPEVFDQLPERRYRFVHVDVDLYAPTRAAFEYFVARLVPGGVAMTDDYKWPGGRRAVDEFSRQSGLRLHTTDSHQAFLIAP